MEYLSVLALLEIDFISIGLSEDERHVVIIELHNFQLNNV